MDENDKPSTVNEHLPVLQEYPLCPSLLELIPAKAQKGLSTFDIEFTCIDADGQYLCIGTNIGIVYLFDRGKGCLHKLKDPDIKDKITCVKILISLECLVAFGSKNGTVLVFKVPFRTEEEIEKFTVEGLHTTTVTSLEWVKNGMKFFSGDESGIVVCTEIDHFEHQSRSRILINESSKVVQLSYSHFNLVVSTLHRSVIYSCKDGSCNQIGQKERKCYGPFGAVIVESDKNEIVLASRPGQRLWKSDLSGVICETILFKDAILQVHPTVSLLSNFLGNNLADFQFERLLKYDGKYILVWSDSALLLIDPNQKTVVASCPKLDPICDVCTCNNEIFILRGLRHLVRISSELDPFADIKTVEEPSIIEEMLVPLKEFSSFVKERSDSLSLQIEKNPTIFDWLKRKRSQSSPADFSNDSMITEKACSVETVENLPGIVKLNSSEISAIKLESSENVPKIEIRSILKDDSDDIVFKPKKNKKKPRKVRFASDASPRTSKHKTLITKSNVANKNDNEIVGNDNHEINQVTQNQMDKNANQEISVNNVTDDLNCNDSVVPNITDVVSKTESDFLVQGDIVNRNESRESLFDNKQNVDTDKMLETILNAYSHSKCHDEKVTPISESSNLESNNSHLDQNERTIISEGIKPEAVDTCKDVSEAENQDKLCTTDSVTNFEKSNDPEEIYSSFVSEKIETDLLNSTCSNDSLDSPSGEESSVSSLDITPSEPSKYGVNWVEYKAPELLLDLSTSDDHIFCVDVQNRLYFSKYPVLGLQWIDLCQPAEKVAASPSENVVWALYNGTVFAAVQNAPTLWLDFEWLSAARNVISIAVDDDCGWYISSNGQLLVQQKLTASKPYGYPQSIPCKNPVAQVACRNGIVWVLTTTGFLLGSKNNDTKNMLWKDIQLYEVPGVNSICLGVQQTGWIVDSYGIIRFLIGVTPETPEGIGKPWQVEEISSYLPQQSSQLHKSVLKALNTEARNLIRGKQSICISTSSYGVWFCKTLDNLVYSSQKAVIGHTWEPVVPPSTASTTKWSLIASNGMANSEGALWCVNSAGELFCYGIVSKSLVTVDLPSIAGIQCLEPGEQCLWILSIEGGIFIRRGITPNCLQGAWWQALNLTQLNMMEIISLSCSPNVSWACTSDGQVLMRIGTLAPSTRSNLPQAWIPVNRDHEEMITSPIINKLSAIGKHFPLPLIHPSLSDDLFHKICVGPLGYPVWAVDKRGNLYVRDGVTTNLPIGSKWISIPDLHAKDLCISKNAVWVLKQSGKIYRRFGVSEKNPCGLYWKRMPGCLDFLSVTADDDLWGLKDGAMFFHSSFVINSTIKDGERKLATRSVSEEDWEDLTADDLEE